MEEATEDEAAEATEEDEPEAVEEEEEEEPEKGEGALVEEEDLTSTSPLIAAAAIGDLETTQSLLEQGYPKNKDETTTHGSTAKMLQ